MNTSLFLISNFVMSLFMKELPQSKQPLSSNNNVTIANATQILISSPKGNQNIKLGLN